MASGTANKFKVAFICHFSNHEIRKKLPLSMFRVQNAIRSYLGKNKKNNYSDFAPWVTNLIKEFEKFEEVELHVIAPHKGLTRLTHDFELNGVYYHFFKPDLPFIHKKIPRKLLLGRKPIYYANRFFIKRLIKSIKPDIVDLIGTENPYYSIASLDIKNIPIYVSVQTVYTNPDRKKLSGSCDRARWNLELEIHQKVKYYGCGGRMHRDLILKNNPNAIILKKFFPKSQPTLVKDINKKYDFVFFAAGVTKKKGIEDAIEALAKVKKHKNEVSLNVVGSCSSEYKRYLLNKIDEYELKQNIVFHDYFPLQSGMFKHIQKSKFAILPIKLDVIPGTILEAMYLELPVVTYKTTGTPYLNKNDQCVLLSDIGDIDILAKHMIKLLNSPSFAEKLKSKAKVFVEKEFDSTSCAKRFLKNYKAVINHYYHNKPVPKELSFDLKEFPVY